MTTTAPKIKRPRVSGWVWKFDVNADRRAIVVARQHDEVLTLEPDDIAALLAADGLNDRQAGELIERAAGVRFNSWPCPGFLTGEPGERVYGKPYRGGCSVYRQCYPTTVIHAIVQLWRLGLPIDVEPITRPGGRHHCSPMPDALTIAAGSPPASVAPWTMDPSTGTRDCSLWAGWQSRGGRGGANL